MRQKTKACIMVYVNEDKKSFNPGVIITSNTTDEEITKITYDMQQEDRNVRIFTTHIVDDISQLPPLDEPIGEGLKGYTYDPYLMW